MTMADTPLNMYQRVPPPSDPDSAQSHLDGELQKLERTTRETITKLQAVASTYAPIADPVFTGDPKAPTPATGDNDTSIATTAFVKAQDYATHTDLTSGLSTKADSSALSGYATTSALTSGLAGKEPTITGSGNAQQYWAGDKTFRALPAQKLVSAQVAKLSGTVLLNTTLMPNSSGAPANTDGYLILTLSVTTTSATQVVDLLFNAFGICGTNSLQPVNGALYANGVAFAAASQLFNGSGGYSQFQLAGRYSPGAAGTYTITVRMGLATAVSNVTLNGNFGSLAATQLRAEVIEP